MKYSAEGRIMIVEIISCSISTKVWDRTRIKHAATADPGVMSLIAAQSHTFVEIDHEIISTVILLPSYDSRRVVVSYK